MRVIIIGAMTADRVIGDSRRGLPWNVPDDYRHFLDTVRGHTVLFGRVSYELFHEDLADTEMIVVSRSVAALPDAHVVPSIDRAFALARTFGRDLYISGGAEIYAQTLDRADRIYLSVIPGRYRGDRCFPELGPEWTEVRDEDRGSYRFLEYHRVSRGDG